MSVVNMYDRDTVIVVSGLGDYVKGERGRLGMSQTELAEKAGIQQPNLSDIERGRNKNTSPDTRRRIAQALGISHLSLLVAAGEITDAEIGSAGAVGVVDRDPDDPLLEVIDDLQSVRLNDRLRRRLARRIAFEIADVLSWDREDQDPDAPPDWLERPKAGQRTNRAETEGGAG